MLQEFILAVLLIGILYAIFAAFANHDHIDMRTADKKVVIWDDYMEKTQEGEVYYYKYTLPSENTNEKVIVYNTVHMYLEVFIDGDKVYELKGEIGKAVRTTGFYWNIISLTEDDAGKEIVFQVTPVYDGSKPNGNFYYGTYREIEHKILTERIFRFTLAVCIALAGIVILLYSFLVVKKDRMPRQLYNLPYLP